MIFVGELQHFFKSVATSGDPGKCLGLDVANLIKFFSQDGQKILKIII